MNLEELKELILFLKEEGIAEFERERGEERPGRGDQHVYVKVVTPTDPSSKERQVLEQLRDVSKKQPQPH